MASTRPIRIGLVVSLTGPLAPMGVNACRGLQLWAETASLGSRRIALVVRDDASTQSQLRRELERLLDDERVELLAGPYSSGLVRTAARLAEERGVVLWNHGGSADDIHRGARRCVVSVPSPASRYMVPALHDVPTGPVVVIGRTASGFSLAVRRGVEAEAARQRRLVSFESYPDFSWEVDVLAARLRTARPALIIGAGRFADDVELARALRRTRVEVPTVLVAAGVRAFGDAVANADGFLGPSQWEPEASIAAEVGPTARGFADHFRRRFGVTPDYLAAQAFAAGLVMGCCVDAAGATEQKALRDAADRLDLTTTFGRFRIDPATGLQVGHRMLLVRWQRGERRVVDTLSLESTMTCSQ